MVRSARSSSTWMSPTSPLTRPSRSKRRSTRMAVSTVVPAASARARRVTWAAPPPAPVQERAREARRRGIVREGPQAIVRVAQATRHHVEDLHRRARLLLHQSHEQVAGDPPGRAAAHRLGARRVRLRFEGRHRAEDLPGAENVQGGEVPVGGAL